MSYLIAVPSSPQCESQRAILRQVVSLPSVQDPAILNTQADFVSLATTIGLTRSSNDDRLAVVRAPAFEQAPAWTALVLSDGMGGLRNGGQAAEIATASFINELLRERARFTPNAMARAVRVADRFVRSEVPGGGATLSAVCWDSSRVLTVNVGDSRIWGISRRGEVHPWSRDDSIAAQLQAHGLPIEGDGARRELVQYVGFGDELQPHVEVHAASDVRMIVLTSDGAHGAHLSDMRKVLECASTPREIVVRLVHLSLWLGGSDNASAVAMSIAPVTSPPNIIAELWTPSGYWRLYPEIAKAPDRSHALRAEDRVEPSKSSSLDPGNTQHSSPRTYTEKTTSQKPHASEVRGGSKRQYRGSAKKRGGGPLFSAGIEDKRSIGARRSPAMDDVEIKIGSEDPQQIGDVPESPSDVEPPKPTGPTGPGSARDEKLMRDS